MLYRNLALFEEILHWKGYKLKRISKPSFLLLYFFILKLIVITLCVLLNRSSLSTTWFMLLKAQIIYHGHFWPFLFSWILVLKKLSLYSICFSLSDSSWLKVTSTMIFSSDSNSYIKIDIDVFICYKINTLSH